MIRITQHQAPHVSMEDMQSTPRPATDEAFPGRATHLNGMQSTLQWGYCSLACDANHVTWSDRRPSYVARFRNLMPSLRARRAAGMGVYTTVDLLWSRQQQGVHWLWVVYALYARWSF